MKQLKNFAEECRVSVRQARKEANDILKKQKGSSEISEDDYHKFSDKVQKITDDFISKVDSIAQNKEKDIMTV